VHIVVFHRVISVSSYLQYSVVCVDCHFLCKKKSSKVLFCCPKLRLSTSFLFHNRYWHLSRVYTELDNRFSVEILQP
jgi:hypothetical protein